MASQYYPGLMILEAKSLGIAGRVWLQRESHREENRKIFDIISDVDESKFFVIRKENV